MLCSGFTNCNRTNKCEDVLLVSNIEMIGKVLNVMHRQMHKTLTLLKKRVKLAS